MVKNCVENDSVSNGLTSPGNNPLSALMLMHYVNPYLFRHFRSLKAKQHSKWWRYQMETFSALLAICEGNSPVPGEFPAQRPVTRSLDIFFDLRLNKRLSEQSWGWWFETLLCPLWRHRNEHIFVGSCLCYRSFQVHRSQEITTDYLIWIYDIP